MEFYPCIQAYFDVEMKIKIKPKSFTPVQKLVCSNKIVKNCERLDCNEGLFKKIGKLLLILEEKIRNSLKTLNYSQIKFDSPILTKGLKSWRF